MSEWLIDPMDVALGHLENSHRQSAEQLMQTDAEFRAQVDAAARVVASLNGLSDEAWNPPAPPPLRMPDAAHAPRRHQRRRQWAFGVGAGAVAAAAVVTLVVAGRGSNPAPSRQLQLSALANTPGSVNLRVLKTSVKLIADGLPSVDARHHYEAWAGTASGRMVSMGTFRVDGTGKADVSMPLALDLAAYSLVDISLEEDDNNPAHSTKSVFRGSL